MISEKKNPCTVTNNHKDTAQGDKEAIENNFNEKDTTQEKKLPITAATAGAKALEFRENSPHNYKILANIAFGMLARHERLSMSRVVETARIMPEFNSTEENKPFKINNTLQAALARLLMQDYPQLEGKFETRKSLSDEVLGYGKK